MLHFGLLIQTSSARREFLPEICDPVPDDSSGALAEKYDEFHGFRDYRCHELRRMSLSYLTYMIKSMSQENRLAF